jgi:oligopeptide/dipeptide ABC transporter ATP-binding protein
LIPAPGEIVAGQVRLGDTDLVGLPERELARLRGRRVALISQEPLSSLDPSFTVGFQLTEVTRHHLGLSKAQARARAQELLARVGLPDPARVLCAYPHELSGGMAQRVMIALALSCEPDVLIADEPTTALDVTVQAEVLDLLRSLRDELGMAIVFVTHDLGVAAELCDRVAIMYAGQVVEEGPVSEVFAQPEHPYTAALLASDPGAAGDRLADIPGTVPPPHAWSDGCRFAPRCAHARAECAQAVALRADGLPAARAVRCARAEDLTLEGVA